MKNELEILDKVERVQAPPFLYTRIEARLQSISEEVYSKPVLASFALSLILLCVINFSLLNNSKQKTQARKQINTLTEGYKLNKTNQLYYE